jgi:hypothetical protein
MEKMMPYDWPRAKKNFPPFAESLINVTLSWGYRQGSEGEIRYNRKTLRTYVVFANRMD